MAEADADGYERRGKVFCVRLADEEREQLRQLYQGEGRDLIPWHYRSLGRFMVWAALQWKPRQEGLPLNGRDADGTVRRNGVVVAKRVRPLRVVSEAKGGTIVTDGDMTWLHKRRPKTKRPGRGNTGRPGGRRPKAKKARR